MLSIVRAMNVFTTDHPLASEPFRLSRRVKRWLAFLILVYPAYLLSLGPFWALDGRGCLEFIPDGVHRICYAPVYPICLIPHVRGRYADYMDWWYLDPNAADRETGWD
jgi:hypothetical protein